MRVEELRVVLVLEIRDQEDLPLEWEVGAFERWKTTEEDVNAPYTRRSAKL